MEYVVRSRGCTSGGGRVGDVELGGLGEDAVEALRVLDDVDAEGASNGPPSAGRVEADFAVNTRNESSEDLVVVFHDAAVLEVLSIYSRHLGVAHTSLVKMTLKLARSVETMFQANLKDGQS